VSNRLRLNLPNVGLRHGNKANGPKCFIDKHCSGAKSDEPFYDPDAHAIDLATVLHRTPPPCVLGGGGKRWTNYMKDASKFWAPKSVKSLVVCYDYAKYVPAIKVLEQGNRTSMVENVDGVFDPTSAVPIPGSHMFQGYIRSNNNRTRMAEQVCHDLLDGSAGTDFRGVNVTFYGVVRKDERAGRDIRGGETRTTGGPSALPGIGMAAGHEVPSRAGSGTEMGTLCDGSAVVGSPHRGTDDSVVGIGGGDTNDQRSYTTNNLCNQCGSDAAVCSHSTLMPKALKEPGTTMHSGGEKGDTPGCEKLLHQRIRDFGGVKPRSEMGPGIGEGELAAVHFIVNWRKHCALKPEKWLVTSSDTDELMVILLAMATGAIAAEDTSSDSQVKVTIKRVINGETDYLYVNRVFYAICTLKDGSEEAWPSLEVCYWLKDDVKVCLFVLVYVLSGCDFLPCIGGMDFAKLWKFSLKALRAEGLFREDPIIVQREGKLRVNINAGLKLLGSAYFFKHEAAFSTVTSNPLDVWEKEKGNLSGFLSSIARGIFGVKDGKCSNLFLPERSMELQLLRADAVLEYWQAAFEPTMPELCFEGRGWGKAPQSNGQQSTCDMNKENIVLHLSDYAYIDTTGKLVTLTCTCDPNAARRHGCRRCRCGKARRKCVMSSCRCRCGCIPTLGSCVTSTETDKRPTSDEGVGIAGGDANAERESDSERQGDGDMGNDGNAPGFFQESSARYFTPEQGKNYPHGLWATEPGCAGGDIRERVRGAHDNNDVHRGAEADTTLMLESILQEFT